MQGYGSGKPNRFRAGVLVTARVRTSPPACGLIMPLKYSKPQQQKKLPLIYFKGSEAELTNRSRRRELAKLVDAALEKRELSKTSKILGIKRVSPTTKKIIAEVRKAVIEIKGYVSYSKKLVNIPLPNGEFLPLIVNLSANGNVLVMPASLSHGIRQRRVDAFEELKLILNQGLKGTQKPNVTFGEDRIHKNVSNVIFAGKDRRYMDSYAVEYVNPYKKTKGQNDPHIDFISPNNLTKVTIYLSSLRSKQETEQMKEFYRKNLPEITIRFIQSRDDLERQYS